MATRAEKIITFNRQLLFDGALPQGVEVLNPFKENPEATVVSEAFYRKYYDDTAPRRLLLGINPGRFGAGLTGIPFTDPKRLVEKLNLPYEGKREHEPSSVFVYEMIDAFGGADLFYGNFYIHSVFPLAIVYAGDGQKPKNYNYYDSKELCSRLTPFAVENIRKQQLISGTENVCFCIGSGANFKHLTELNRQHGFFKTIVPLEHPRFIMQYKHRQKAQYMVDYIEKLKSYQFT